jgi:hypothetical protein
MVSTMHMPSMSQNHFQLQVHRPAAIAATTAGARTPAYRGRAEINADWNDQYEQNQRASGRIFEKIIDNFLHAPSLAKT